MSDPKDYVLKYLFSPFQPVEQNILVLLPPPPPSPPDVGIIKQLLLSANRVFSSSNKPINDISKDHENQPSSSSEEKIHSLLEQFLHFTKTLNGDLVTTSCAKMVYQKTKLLKILGIDVPTALSRLNEFGKMKVGLKLSDYTCGPKTEDSISPSSIPWSDEFSQVKDSIEGLNTLLSNLYAEECNFVTKLKWFEIDSKAVTVAGKCVSLQASQQDYLSLKELATTLAKFYMNFSKLNGVMTAWSEIGKTILFQEPESCKLFHVIIHKGEKEQFQIQNERVSRQIERLHENSKSELDAKFAEFPKTNQGLARMFVTVKQNISEAKQLINILIEVFQSANILIIDHSQAREIQKTEDAVQKAKLINDEIVTPFAYSVGALLINKIGIKTAFRAVALIGLVVLTFSAKSFIRYVARVH